MGISNFKSGYGMTNAQFMDALLKRVREEKKGPLTAAEAEDFTAKLSDLCEPISRFSFYLQNRIGPLRSETDIEQFARVTEKLREMIEDFIAHPEMYKF